MRNFKKYSLAVVAVTAALAAQSVFADQLDDIKKRGTLICGTLGTSEPFSFADQATREIKGYDVDFCKEEIIEAPKKPKRVLNENQKKAVAENLKKGREKLKLKQDKQKEEQENLKRLKDEVKQKKADKIKKKLLN